MRFAPLLSLLVRARLSAQPIQTIAPAFDGLKVFPSLAEFLLTTTLRLGRLSCSDLPARRCLSPPGSPHLPHSQEGYGVSSTLRWRGYLQKSGPDSWQLGQIFLGVRVQVITTLRPMPLATSRPESVPRVRHENPNAENNEREGCHRVHIRLL